MIATKRPPGEILPGSMYTIQEARARLGLGHHAWIAARKRGLVVRRVGKCGFILGSDLIAYVLENDRAAL